MDHAHRAVFRSTGPGGRTVFVKVEEGRTRAGREVAGIDAAARAGVPVPALLHVELGALSVLVLGAVGGRSLGTTDDDRSWADAARHLARLHRLPVPGGVERFDHREGDWIAFMRWWIAHETSLVVEAGMLDRTLSLALLRRTDDVLEAMAPARRALLHGDCQPDHVLVDDDDGRVLALIDWGDAATGDPRWDLAVLTAHHPARLPLVAEAHGSPPADAAIVGAYWTIRHLGSATWMADHGFDPAPDLRAAAAQVT